MSGFEKQWWALRWNLAALISFLILSGATAFHILFKAEKIREVEVPVEVIKEIPVEGIECPFLECFSYKGYSFWYQGPQDCCNDLDFVIKFDKNNSKQRIVLNNAMPEIKEIYNDFYESMRYEEDIIRIELDDYLSMSPLKNWADPKKELVGNKKVKEKLFKAIDDSEKELTEMFKK